VFLLDDDRLRQIAECKLEGYRNEEIASGWDLPRGIERKLQRIRQVCENKPANDSITRGATNIANAAYQCGRDL
jgi:hypothetical protein